MAPVTVTVLLSLVALVALVAAAAAVSAAITWRGRASASGAATAGAANQQAAADRDAAIHAALQQAAVLQREQLEQVTVHHRQLLEQAGVLQREQLGAQLAAGQRELAADKELIDARLGQVQGDLRAQMDRLGQLVAQLGQRNAEQLGRVD